MLLTRLLLPDKVVMRDSFSSFYSLASVRVSHLSSCQQFPVLELQVMNMVFSATYLDHTGSFQDVSSFHRNAQNRGVHSSRNKD